MLRVLFVIVLLLSATASNCGTAPAGSTLPASACIRSYYNAEHHVGFNVPSGVIGPDTSESDAASNFLSAVWYAADEPDDKDVFLYALDSTDSLDERVAFELGWVLGNSVVTKSEPLAFNSGQDGWLIVTRLSTAPELFTVKSMLISNGRYYKLIIHGDESEGVYDEALLTGLARSLCVD